MRRSRFRIIIPENEFQKQVVEMFRISRLPNAMLLHIRNEGKRPPAECAALAAMGMKTGAADLLIFVGTRGHFLELKRADGRQSVAQKAFQLECEMLRIPYAVARGFDEARDQLAAWGAIRVSSSYARAA